ncbi:MAG: S1 RNA-binding domain-containing protein [Planctomycetota bacterium]|nr:S1 RNA-binding domain-containing protein [Planctomycetota bacterium]
MFDSQGSDSVGPRALHNSSDATVQRDSQSLRVHEGTIVGIFGNDVFVDLGPRLQGVLSVSAFPEPPHEGDLHNFTLRGREESLWALSLVGDRSLPSWQGMREGQWISARVVREHQGHLQLKVEHLHAVMPHTHTGKTPGQSVKGMVGKTLVCEVLEVDQERQRVVLSRKRVLQQEREMRRKNMTLLPGDVTRGRVIRIEEYGVFLRLNGGRDGLLHISDISHARLDHPADRLSMGETIEVKVLRMNRGGKRISLGLKQLIGNPWRSFAKHNPPGSYTQGTVVMLLDAGVVVRFENDESGWQGDTEGFIPRSETPYGHRRLGIFLRPGQAVPLRVLEIHPDEQSLTLSMLDVGGRALSLQETEAQAEWKAKARQKPPAENAESPPLGTTLAAQLQSAMARNKEA